MSRTLQEVDAFVAFRFIQCTIFIQPIYSLALIFRFLLWFLITVFRGDRLLQDDFFVTFGTCFAKGWVVSSRVGVSAIFAVFDLSRILM